MVMGGDLKFLKYKNFIITWAIKKKKLKNIKNF